MPNAFDFTASPFDCLDAAEQRVVRDSVDIAYFRADETLLDPGIEPSHLFVIIKGHVAQFDGDELVSTFGPNDSFDGRSLVAGRASSRFVAAEEVVAYQLAKAAVNELISRNATFGALLFSDLSIKLGALAQRHSQREMQALTQSRVAEAFLRPAHFVEGDTDIVGVAALMHAQRSSSVLVRDGERLGIFTNTGLQRAIVDGRPLATLPVRELATFELVTISPDAPLFDALALMIQHQVHRLVVDDGETHRRAAGTARPAELPVEPFVPDHRADRAVAEPGRSACRGQADHAAGDLAVPRRHACGPDRQARASVERQVVRAHLAAGRTPALFADSCLFVMGSEGRGEQLLKTDQDNGLILRDGAALDAAEVARHASASRPPCATTATPIARAASWSATRCGDEAPATLPRTCATGCCGPTPKG
jgi:CBS domain-containing protein